MRLAPLSIVVLTGLCVGCSLPRGVLQPTGGVDAYLDQDMRVDVDGGTETPDAPLDDVPDTSTCVAQCDGNAAVTCPGGQPHVTVCNGMVCDASSGTPMCLPLICVPDAASCSTDGTMMIACNHLGTVNTTTHCDRGCTANACRPMSTCTEPVAGALAAGTFQVDLCHGTNDHTDDQSHGDCPTMTIANGDDVMYRLDLDHTQRVTISETDASTAHDVNPIVYLRSVCSQRSSEVDCNDNGAFPSAALDEVLTAGEYFVIFDSFDDASHACGVVSITIAISTP